jgi:hypothetical protein
MDQSGREDPKLSEVRAVLHRLQGLPTEPQPAGSQSAAPAPKRGRLIGIAGVTIGVVGVVLAVAYAVPTFKQQEAATPATFPGPSSDRAKGSVAPGALTDPAAPPPHQAGTTTPRLKQAVEAAMALMTGGRVQAARQQLLAMASDGSPDVAWALARSYDPNYLGAIAGADAGPDIAEATRWYRQWYAAAVKQGMVNDSVSLERIIGSMKR